MGGRSSTPKGLPDGCGPQCKQVAETTLLRFFALAITLMAIVLMVLVWMGGLVFQIVNFILAFLMFGLGVLAAIWPVKCVRCPCS
jgi:peptidoglycan/LPS O-acetylase OafA/YrhL